MCSLRKKLPRFVDPGSVLYIATNEDTPGFFDPLKDLYTIYMLEDFAHLWGPNSTWFDEFRRLLKTDNPEFDVYMKVWCSSCSIVYCTVVQYSRSQERTHRCADTVMNCQLLAPRPLQSPHAALTGLMASSSE